MRSVSTVVLVMSAAPSAIFFACSNNLSTPSAVPSRNIHHTAAVRGITLGWFPPLVMTRWARMLGIMCSRYCASPMSISTTPSSASRPFQGATPAWAVSPWNVKGAEISADVIGEADVDVFQPAVTHEIGPADQLLLGRRAEHLEGALEAVAIDRGLGG